MFTNDGPAAWKLYCSLYMPASFNVAHRIQEVSPLSFGWFLHDSALISPVGPSEAAVARDCLTILVQLTHRAGTVGPFEAAVARDCLTILVHQGLEQ
jgi:hypothetical protein